MIHNIIKKKIKKLYNFFLTLNHKINPIGTSNKSILYTNNHIIDLDRDWIYKKEEIKIISYQDQHSLNLNDKYPIIESWIMQEKKTFTINRFFRESQYKKIYNEINKEVELINEELYVLPYYTSHFGHFVGDLLGSIIYYLQKFKDTSKKILIYCPSEKWENFFLNNFSKNIYLVSPNILLKKNLVLKNSVILPRMSSFQNIQLARNYFLSIPANQSVSQKIFLTSCRSSRISNIDELKKVLIKENFLIINPSDLNILDLYKYIRNSKFLICEKASILNNLLFSRDKVFYLLSSVTERNFDEKFFVGAGIYKTFLINIIKEIYCEDDPKFQNEKPYKTKIRVKIKNILNIIKDSNE